MPILFRKTRHRTDRVRLRRVRRWLFFLAVLILLTLFILRASLYFRELSAAMALSNATDLITMTINDIVLQTMSDPQLTYDYFVTLERDNEGRITAIITNMVQVNTLSAKLLNAVVKAADQGELDLSIPLGDLMGISFLLGRGPRVPVKITLLTSSHADFHNELISVGINQTKHQVMLSLIVDADVLLPWEVLSTQLESSILVAENMIVGQVPDTYLNWAGFTP